MTTQLLFYVLSNNFSYTQVVSAFVFQKDFHNFFRPFFNFCLFLLQKDFETFLVLLFGVFLCIFGNLFAIFNIYGKKNIKNILLVFLCFKKKKKKKKL